MVLNAYGGVLDVVLVRERIGSAKDNEDEEGRLVPFRDANHSLLDISIRYRETVLDIITIPVRIQFKIDSKCNWKFSKGNYEIVPLPMMSILL